MHAHSDTLPSSLQYQFGDTQQNQSTDVRNSAHSVHAHSDTLPSGLLYQFGDVQQNQSTDVRNSAHSAGYSKLQVTGNDTM